MDVVACVGDIAASGGYWLACSADQIFVANTSMVGSISVIHRSFGVEKMMEKLGVETRVITAGSSKDLMDLFKPLKDEDVDTLKAVIDSVHKVVIKNITKSRGSRLSEDDETIFSGKIWGAEEALELGFVDGGIETVESFIKDKYGSNVDVVKIGNFYIFF